MLKNIVVGIAVILIAGSVACSRSRTYTSKDGSVTLEQKGKDGGSMTFTGKNGETVAITMDGGKVPADYPKDAPLYEGTKVIMSNTASEKHAKHLVMESKDPADKIADYYKKGLESNGWKIEGTMNMGQMNMFTAAKENRQLVIQIADGGDKRTITQILSDK